jgi:hypothetical protein
MPQLRTVQLKLRLTPTELRTWKAAAKRCKVPMSVWLREACEARRAKAK